MNGDEGWAPLGLFEDIVNMSFFEVSFKGAQVNSLLGCSFHRNFAGKTLENARFIDFLAVENTSATRNGWQCISGQT